MRANLFFALLTLLATTAFPQGFNPSYAVEIAITYRAPQGSIPVDVEIRPPAYPFEMRRAGLSGEVTFELTVEDDGRVSDVVVTKSDQPEFKTAALAALKTWTFRPSKLDPGSSPRPLRLVGKICFRIVDE